MPVSREEHIFVNRDSSTETTLCGLKLLEADNPDADAPHYAELCRDCERAWNTHAAPSEESKLLNALDDFWGGIPRQFGW